MTEQDIIDICNNLGIKYIDGFLSYNGLLIGRRGLSNDRSSVFVSAITDDSCDDIIKLEENLKKAIVAVKKFEEKQKMRQMEADFE